MAPVNIEQFWKAQAYVLAGCRIISDTLRTSFDVGQDPESSKVQQAISELQLFLGAVGRKAQVIYPGEIPVRLHDIWQEFFRVARLLDSTQEALRNPGISGGPMRVMTVLQNILDTYSFIPMTMEQLDCREPGPANYELEALRYWRQKIALLNQFH
ncbi:hypothetical protein N7462_011172 [Penicillium macrosclerotiorum]|uniref:uncharacterized protein n=1 Tax=Penicillium macrosclerotiorum TaxID=303699 RepID=UPI0025478981|nr:uncharacterized protein N7462_011172 [Penicillium macrosclerotiorum]KAJ5666763.1 hypothetical protein N7462_011172 [Penicillium macrosclerotiorum]